MVKQRGHGESDEDEEHMDWILDAVGKIRYQKQCPNEARICNIVTSKHDVSYDDVLEYIKVAVEHGKILQIFNFKNVATYKDPRAVSKLQSRCLVISPGTDLVKVIVRSVRELGESDGTSLSKLEEHISSSYSVRLKDGTDLAAVLQFQTTQAVLSGQLIREGSNFKLSELSASTTKSENGKRSNLTLSLNKTRMAVAEDMAVGPKDIILPFERKKETKEPAQACSICEKENLLDGQAEVLVSCADCGSGGHPSCLKFGSEKTARVSCMRWQCMKCKQCAVCASAEMNDQVQFCDECDRGYHFKCCDPELTESPEGPWSCLVCDPTKTGETGQLFLRRAKRYTMEMKARQINAARQKKKNARKYQNNKHKTPKRFKPFDWDDGAEEDVPVASDPLRPGGNLLPNCTEADYDLFKLAQERAQKAVAKATGSKDLSSESHGRNPPCIVFGKYEITTWYSAPYPQEYARLSMLYICEYCLKYMKSFTGLQHHMGKCQLLHPPGDEIYRNESLSVFEVDGNTSKLYCQNLCLLAKLFLDHKTLYFDVEPFLFYVLTHNDDTGSHIIGYFSKERDSEQKYNVSCIMTMPQYQRKGYGRFLIDFSYLLSRKENVAGSPEKPLSELGRVSYMAYWKSIVFEYLHSHSSQSVNISAIGKATGMCVQDIIDTLTEQELLKHQGGKLVFIQRPKMIADYVENQKARCVPRLQLDAECLHWMPVVPHKASEGDDEAESSSDEVNASEADTEINVVDEEMTNGAVNQSLSITPAPRSKGKQKGRKRLLSRDSGSVSIPKRPRAALNGLTLPDMITPKKPRTLKADPDDKNHRKRESSMRSSARLSLCSPLSIVATPQRVNTSLKSPLGIMSPVKLEPVQSPVHLSPPCKRVKVEDSTSINMTIPNGIAAASPVEKPLRSLDKTSKKQSHVFPSPESDSAMYELPKLRDRSGRNAYNVYDATNGFWFKLERKSKKIYDESDGLKLKLKTGKKVGPGRKAGSGRKPLVSKHTTVNADPGADSVEQLHVIVPKIHRRRLRQSKLSLFQFTKVRPKRFPRVEARKDLNAENHAQSELQLVEATTGACTTDSTTTPIDHKMDSGILVKDEAVTGEPSPSKAAEQTMEQSDDEVDSGVTVKASDEEGVCRTRSFQAEDSDTTDSKQSRGRDTGCSSSDDEEAEEAGRVGDDDPKESDDSSTEEEGEEEPSSQDHETSAASDKLASIMADSGLADVSEERDTVLGADHSESLSPASSAHLDRLEGPSPLSEEVSSPPEEVQELTQQPEEEKELDPLPEEVDELNISAEEIGALSQLAEEGEKLIPAEEEMDQINLLPEEEDTLVQEKADELSLLPEKVDEADSMPEGGIKLGQVPEAGELSRLQGDAGVLNPLQAGVEELGLLPEAEELNSLPELSGLQGERGELGTLSEEVQALGQLPSDRDEYCLLSEGEALGRLSDDGDRSSLLPENGDLFNKLTKTAKEPVQTVEFPKASENPTLCDENDDNDDSSSFESSFFDFQNSPLRAPRPPTPLSPYSSLDNSAISPAEKGDNQCEASKDYRVYQTFLTEVDTVKESASANPVIAGLAAEEAVSPLLTPMEVLPETDCEKDFASMLALKSAEENTPSHPSQEYSLREHSPQEHIPQEQPVATAEQATPCVAQSLTEVQQSSPAHIHQVPQSLILPPMSVSPSANNANCDASCSSFGSVSSGEYPLLQEKDNREVGQDVTCNGYAHVTVQQPCSGSRPNFLGCADSYEHSVNRTSSDQSVNHTSSHQVSFVNQVSRAVPGNVSLAPACRPDNVSSFRSSSLSHPQEQLHVQCSEAQTQAHFISQHSAVQSQDSTAHSAYMSGLVAGGQMGDRTVRQGYSLQYGSLAQPLQQTGDVRSGSRTQIAPPLHLTSASAVSINPSIMHCMATSPMVGLQPQASQAVLMGGVAGMGGPGIGFQQHQRSTAMNNAVAGQSTNMAANVAFDPSSVGLAPSPGPFTMYNLCDMQRPVMSHSYFGNPGLIASLQPTAQMPLQTGMVNMTVPHHAFPQQLQQSLPRANIFLNNYGYNGYLSMNNMHH